MGSFAATLQDRFQSFIKDKGLLGPDSRVLLAVSGGADSMAMLSLFVVCRPGNCSISVVHVNHQLRGAESDGDEMLVQKTAKKLGIPFHPRRIDVKGYQNETGLSTQEAARELRYQCYEEVRILAGADVVATAHHADDNAETVLMNSLRGAGVRGLSGIPLRRSPGNIIRPLLFCRREELRQYADEMQISFREDSSNSSLNYTRNFLRRELLPALEEKMQTDIVASLNRVSAVMQSMGQRLDAEVRSTFDDIVSIDGNQYVVSIPALSHQPVYLQEEIMLHLFRLLAIEPTARKIQACLSLLHLPTGRSFRLQKEWSLYRDRDRLIFANPAASSFRHSLEMGREYVFPHFRFSIRPVETFPVGQRHGNNVEYVDANRLNGLLVLRTWKEGDSFVPFGMTGEKKLSDFFTDKKIPLASKHHTPLFEADGRIVWVCGLRLDNRFRVTGDTQAIARLDYIPLEDSMHNMP